MPSRLAISSALKPEPSRNALSRFPISSNRMAMTGSMSPAQPLGSVERGGDDALVAGAAAQVAGDRHPHLLLGRIGIVAQELGQRDQHPGCTETALQAVIVAKRLLQRVQLLGVGRE